VLESNLRLAEIDRYNQKQFKYIAWAFDARRVRVYILAVPKSGLLCYVAVREYIYSIRASFH
jgi:hypothetical protein